MPFQLPAGTVPVPGSQGFDVVGRMNPLQPKNLPFLLSMVPVGGAASLVIRKPMILAQVIQKSMIGAAYYAALAPLRPALQTSVLGSYKGKKYEPHIGFGFEGKTRKARKHSFVGPLVRMYMGGSPAGRWVGSLEVPTFGFGIESREVASTRYQTSTERISSPRSSDRPKSSQQVRGRRAGAPSTFTSGYSRPAKRSDRKGASVLGGGRNPFCWVHKRRHWCKYTRQ